MAYKKVEDFRKSPRLDPTRNGDGTESEFVLLSAKQVESKTFPGKMNSVYSVRYNGEDLPALIAQNKAEFPQFENDHLMTLWGSPILDRKLGEAELGPEGVQTKVVYLGEIPHQKKGYNPLKNYDVYFDDGSGDTTPAPKAKGDIPF